MQPEPSFPCPWLIEVPLSGDNELTTTTGSVASFFERRQNQSYSTLITRRGGRILPLVDLHVARLLHGYAVLKGQPHAIEAKELGHTLCRAIAPLLHFIPKGNELRMVAVLKTDSLHVHAAAVKVPPQPGQPVAVECRGAPRKCPDVKDTAWVTLRRPLETFRSQDVEEIVLLDDNGQDLLEGLVTNLFVVMPQNVVHTAPEHLVLPGTIRACVLRACEKLGVLVVMQPPSLADRTQFRAAFLTNALRLLTPIYSFRIPFPSSDASLPECFKLPNDIGAVQMVDQLRRKVIEMLDANAVHILDHVDQAA